MPTNRRTLLAAVERRLTQEPESVLPALRLIAYPDAILDPVDESTVALAKTLNAHRMVSRLRELRARSYTTAEVADMLGGMSRQAVSQRVAKGRLMAIQISGKAYFPAWQFVDGRPVDRLDEMIAALTEIGEDTFSADAVMRTALPEEGGRTIADVLADGDVDLALHYVRAVGGGF